jgi:hypothetical protein
MILEEETFEAFGYEVLELRPKSKKLILAACERCGTFRLLRRDSYRYFCNSCSHILGEKLKGEKHFNFGRYLSEETKAKMSRAHKGKHQTEETKVLLRAANKGEKNPHFNGGRKTALRRQHAKRRKLGAIFLTPLVEGEVGHHVTNKYVIGIPSSVHENLSGYTRRKHRTLVLLWLKENDKKKYKIALCVLAREPF